jgi:hypothetical protein
MTNAGITTGATSAATLASGSTGTGNNIWGANPWVVASRAFVITANAYLKAMDED